MMRVCASRLFLLFQLKAIWSNMENMSVKSFYFSSIVIVSYCRRLLRPNCLIGDYRFIGRTRKMESSVVILPIKGAQYVTQFVSTRTNLLSSPPPKSTPCNVHIRDGRPAPPRPAPPRKIDEIRGAQRGKTDCRFH